VFHRSILIYEKSKIDICGRGGRSDRGEFLFETAGDSTPLTTGGSTSLTTGKKILIDCG